MRFNRLKLKNYRQFKDVEIGLDQVPEGKDLHIFVGVMGVGKSNLLNAINWCLYGEEPFLSREDSQKLPQLNVGLLRETREGEEYRMTVEINAESGGKQLTFIRDQYFKIGDLSEDPNNACKPTRRVFKAILLDENGNSKIFQDADGEDKVRMFVPFGIKDFFFFDGERLDKYFREATGQNIRNAIYQISQVELLDRSHTHIKRVLEDLHKDAGCLDPEIENTRKALEHLEKELQSTTNQIVECGGQIKIAKEKIRELEDNLRGMPEVEGLQKEKEKLKVDYEKQEELYRRLIEAKQEMLFLNGISIWLFPAVDKARGFIRDKRKKKEIPPTIDRNLLQKILKDRKCICSRDVYPGSTEEKSIEVLLQSISLSADTSNELVRMENSLDSSIQLAKSFLETNKKATKELRLVESILKKINDQIEQIDKQIAGYDMIKIRNWSEELKKFEGLYEVNSKRMGVLEKLRDDQKQQVEELKEELEREIKKESRLANIRNDILFAKKAMDVLDNSNQEIMESMRRKIEKETKEKFFELHWKKETYKDVLIKDDYTVSPIHSLGYDCLGTLSGGEREVLALSFSIALHNISGFDSAIIIDRPFAMVSGITRQYISKIFSKISEGRQVILLLTPEDYASDVRELLEKEAVNTRRLSLSIDEKELKIEAY